MKDPYLTPNGIPLAEMRQPSFVEISEDGKTIMTGFMIDTERCYVERTIETTVNGVTRFDFSHAELSSRDNLWNPSIVWNDPNTNESV